MIKPAQSGILAALAIAASGALADARAQNALNEVWIGQSGGTNSIAVTQEGRGNIAGANNSSLQLNQDGDSNATTIDQFGWANQVGNVAFEDGPTGVTQLGNRNELSVTQRNFADDGSNLVGALYQEGGGGLATVANRLTIVQNETGGNGAAAGHVVGIVTQRNNVDNGFTNAVVVTQTGGGFGEGNTTGSVDQQGEDNFFEATQIGRLNNAGTVRQIGTGNAGFLVHDGGVRNLTEFFLQTGRSNSAVVSLEGSRNAVQRIEQNNEPYGANAAGNRAEVTIVGENNGGTGAGGVGSFISAAAAAVGAAQANIVQIGDENDVRVTISGEDNRYGVTQFQDGNFAFVAIGRLNGATALRNEAAIFQDGADNSATIATLGDDNVAAIRQSGDYNVLSVDQNGSGNIADFRLAGDRNNAFGSAFGGRALDIAASQGLIPGGVLQSGNDNLAAGVISGDSNLYASIQSGQSNVIQSDISGLSNQVAVAQYGIQNVSISIQVGEGNTLGVHQF